MSERIRMKVKMIGKKNEIKIKKERKKKRRTITTREKSVICFRFSLFNI
jgi:hypothetical protein